MGIIQHVKEEFQVIKERDPAIKSPMEVLLYPSFRVMLSYRRAHKLYLKGHYVTLYQGVTLGGTGKETGKRHPTIGDNVMISAGAKIIGSFTVGENSKIGAGSVVLEEVPPNCTVVGVPGRVVKRDNIKIPRSDMDQCHLPDPVKEDITLLQRENAELVNRVLDLERQLKEVDRKVRQD